MANELDEPPVPQLNELAKEHVNQLFDVKNLSRLEQVILNALQAAIVNALGAVLSTSASIGAFLADSISKAEDQAAPGFNRLAGVAIRDMFGVDVGDLNVSRGHGGNVHAANVIGDALLRAFSGQARGESGGGGEIQPSDVPA